MNDDQVYAALRSVVDPELGIDVVELGLVYGVQIDGGDVHVRMTMTSAACPMHGHLTQLAANAVRRQVAGATEVTVEVVFDPQWTPEMMSAEARRKLGW